MIGDREADGHEPSVAEAAVKCHEDRAVGQKNLVDQLEVIGGGYRATEEVIQKVVQGDIKRWFEPLGEKTGDGFV